MRELLDRWWRGVEETIAIDVRGADLIVARRGARSLFSDWTIPLPESVVSDVARGQKAAVESICHIVRDCVGDVDPRFARLGVSLPSQSVLVARLPSVSSLSASSPQGALEWARDSLSLDDVNYITRLSSYRVDGDSERVSVVSTKRVVVDLWESVANTLGFELTVVAPRACCIHRAASGSDSTESCLSTVWIDMTESKPCVHQFYGGALARSSTMFDPSNLGTDVESEQKSDLGFDVDGSDRWRCVVRCLLRKGQEPEDVSSVVDLFSRGEQRPEWLADDTLAARGALLMLEDRRRGD